MTKRGTTDRRQPTDAARRMRLFRDRRRSGMRCITVEVHQSELTWLVQNNLLSPEAIDDPREIADALHTFFDQSLRM